MIQMDYCYFGHGDKKKTIIIGTDTDAGGGSRLQWHPEGWSG